MNTDTKYSHTILLCLPRTATGRVCNSQKSFPTYHGVQHSSKVINLLYTLSRVQHVDSKKKQFTQIKQCIYSPIPRLHSLSLGLDY